MIVKLKSPVYEGGGVSLNLRNFPKKWDSEFSTKTGGVSKIYGCSKKGGIILFIYTIFVSNLCVSQEGLVESNQQIYDFYKWMIFKKQRHCGLL